MTAKKTMNEKLWRRTLTLGKKGFASPNPRVGCVIVRDGDIIGEGFHRAAGERHAEIMALEKAGDIRGGEVYINLEPCTHVGLTPPCAPRLIAAQPARVFIILPDANPVVCGKGIAALRQANIAVTVADANSDIARQALLLNVGFYSRMIRKRPWVRLKIAATMDGKTALADGESQWISGDAARKDAHKIRARSCALITGIGTVLHDNPQLTARHSRLSRQPTRILIDKDLRAPPSLKIFNQTAGEVIVATAKKNIGEKEPLAALAKIISLPDGDGKVNLRKLLKILAQQGMNEVTVEAGQKLCGAFLRAGLVDEIVVYFAPRIFGGQARDMFALPPPSSLRQAMRFQRREVFCFSDGDIKITYHARDFYQSLNPHAPAQTQN